LVVLQEEVVGFLNQLLFTVGQVVLGFDQPLLLVAIVRIVSENLKVLRVVVAHQIPKGFSEFGVGDFPELFLGFSVHDFSEIELDGVVYAEIQYFLRVFLQFLEFLQAVAFEL
jgi:hypothetical protein